MYWLFYFFLSLPSALVGLLCGAYIGDLQIRWFHLAGANGSQGWHPIQLALLGGIRGLVVGLITAWNVAPHDTASGLRSAATSSAAVLALALAALGASRSFAHIPPTIDGQELTLQIELRLPPGQAKPALPEKDPNYSNQKIASYFYLTSIGNITRNLGVNGNFDEASTREEHGRWIIPGRAPMETSRGQRALDFFINGQQLPERFIAPVPAHPGAESLPWSGWLPERDDAGQPWPDTKPSYRFRIQKVEPVKPEPELPMDEKSVFAREETKLNAIPAEAGLENYFEFTRYDTPSAIKALALAKMSARPRFAAEMKAAMLNSDAEESAKVIRLIEQVPHPTPELIHAVEAIGRDLADRMQKMNATPAKADPEFLRANDVAIRFSAWITAVTKLRAKDGGDFIPELRAIVELSRVRNDSEAIRQDVRRVAVFYLKEWAGVTPQPDDPKPR